MCTDSSGNLRVLQRVLRCCQPCAPAAPGRAGKRGCAPKLSITQTRTFIGLGAPQAVPSVCLPQALSWNEANSGPQLPHINLRRALPVGPAPVGLLPQGKLPRMRLAGWHLHQLPPQPSTLYNLETFPDGVLIGYPHPCPGDQGVGAKPPRRAAPGRGTAPHGCRPFPKPSQAVHQLCRGWPFICQGQRGPLGLAPPTPALTPGCLLPGDGQGWPGREGTARGRRPGLVV